MNFIESCLDYGTPEYCVTGVSSIQRISTGQIRVTKFSRRREGNIVLFHEVWDLVDWRRTCEIVERLRESILAEAPLSGAEDHPSRQAH